MKTPGAITHLKNLSKSPELEWIVTDTNLLVNTLALNRTTLFFSLKLFFVNTFLPADAFAEMEKERLVRRATRAFLGAARQV